MCRPEATPRRISQGQRLPAPAAARPPSPGHCTCKSRALGGRGPEDLLFCSPASEPPPSAIFQYLAALAADAPPDFRDLLPGNRGKGRSRAEGPLKGRSCARWVRLTLLGSRALFQRQVTCRVCRVFFKGIDPESFPAEEPAARWKTHRGL